MPIAAGEYHNADIWAGAGEGLDQATPGERISAVIIKEDNMGSDTEHAFFIQRLQ